jgi:hypothetical protein
MLVGWTYVSLTSSTFVALNLIEDEQINTVAKEVFNKIILTPGDPVDWNITSVKSLGLAKNDAKAFTLDKNKVLCLKNGSINIDAARNLLGLVHLYDFSLLISPALKVNVTGVSYNAGLHSFNVMVKDLKDLSISNVFVKGYYVNDTGNWNAGDTIERDSTMTGVDGFATLTFSNTNPKDVVLLITAKLSSIVALAECYVQSSSDTSGSTLNPPKSLMVEGDYVVEGKLTIDAFTFPSNVPQGGLKTISLNQFVSIDDYVYVVYFRIWRVSQ